MSADIPPTGIPVYKPSLLAATMLLVAALYVLFDYLPPALLGIFVVAVFGVTGAYIVGSYAHFSRRAKAAQGKGK
jgi:hypothetical protein